VLTTRMIQPNTRLLSSPVEMSFTAIAPVAWWMNAWGGTPRAAEAITIPPRMPKATETMVSSGWVRVTA
jgi:hypothetical protein